MLIGAGPTGLSPATQYRSRPLITRVRPPLTTAVSSNEAFVESLLVDILGCSCISVHTVPYASSQRKHITCQTAVLIRNSIATYKSAALRKIKVTVSLCMLAAVPLMKCLVKRDERALMIRATIETSWQLPPAQHAGTVYGAVHRPQHRTVRLRTSAIALNSADLTCQSCRNCVALADYWMRVMVAASDVCCCRDHITRSIQASDGWRIPVRNGRGGTKGLDKCSRRVSLA